MFGTLMISYLLWIDTSLAWASARVQLFMHSSSFAVCDIEKLGWAWMYSNVGDDYQQGFCTPVPSFLSVGPPAPINTRAVNQSTDTATFTWDPGSLSCSNTLYAVTTMNCGSCEGSIRTYKRTITCNGLNLEQECRLSVRSTLECDAFSSPDNYTFTGMST